MIRAVSDSGPLTHLWQIDSWQALGTFQSLHIATQVAQEVRKHVALKQLESQAGCALRIHNIPQHTIDTHPQATLLHHADIATLILAQQTAPELVLTDDLDLRRAPSKTRDKLQWAVWGYCYEPTKRVCSTHRR